MSNAKNPQIYQSKGELLQHLRQAIQRSEGYRPSAGRNITTRIAQIDAALPGGNLPLAAIHEFMSAGANDGAAAAGFMFGLLNSVMADQGYALWITKSRILFPHGIASFGIDPDRIIFITVRRDQEVLWVMEEALRCKSLTAAIAEISDTDLTATRRLQLATEASGVTGFLLRQNPRNTGTSACTTRWRVQAAPSIAHDGLPGVGHPCWQVELVKARSGQPGSWTVEWRNGGFREVPPPATARLPEILPLVAVR